MFHKTSICQRYSNLFCVACFCVLTLKGKFSNFLNFFLLCAYFEDELILVTSYIYVLLLLSICGVLITTENHLNSQHKFKTKSFCLLKSHL